MAAKAEEQEENVDDVIDVLKQFSTTVAIFRQETNRIGSEAIDRNTMSQSLERTSDDALKRDSKHFRQTVQSVVDLFPKLSIAFKGPPVPKVKDCAPLSGLMASALIQFIAVFQSILNNSCSLLTAQLTRAVDRGFYSLIALSTTLCESVDGSSDHGENDVPVACGVAISTWKSILAIPIDNRLMTQRSMEEPISLIRDAMEEMKQAAEEEKEDCVVEEEEQKTKEDQKKKSASVADMQGTDDLMSALTLAAEDNQALSEKEREIIPDIVTVLKICGGALANVKKSLSRKGPDRKDITISSFDDLIMLANDVSAMVDDLCGTVYSPQDLAACSQIAKKLVSLVQSAFDGVLHPNQGVLTVEEHTKLQRVVGMLLQGAVDKIQAAAQEEL